MSPRLVPAETKFTECMHSKSRVQQKNTGGFQKSVDFQIWRYRFPHESLQIYECLPKFTIFNSKLGCVHDSVNLSKSSSFGICSAPKTPDKYDALKGVEFFDSSKTTLCFPGLISQPAIFCSQFPGVFLVAFWDVPDPNLENVCNFFIAKKCNQIWEFRFFANFGKVHQRMQCVIPQTGHLSEPGCIESYEKKIRNLLTNLKKPKQIEGKDLEVYTPNQTNSEFNP